MKLPQSWEVRAANCRKPCFITPFMEAGTLSQPLLPAGQFSRHRPSGRFPVPRDAPRTPLSDSGPRPARGLSTTRAPCPRGKDGLTSRPARAPEPSERLTPAAPSSRLHWSPTSAHLGAAERCGGGGESLEVGRSLGTRRRARRPRLSRSPPSRRPQGGPTRTPGDARRRKRSPFPSLAAPGPAGAPQCACAEACLIMCALLGRRR